MKTFQKILIIFLFLIGFFTASLAYAGIVNWPIVPCGQSIDDSQSTWNETDSCTLCHLWNLGSNIINFISFNLAIPFATILFVAAGIIFLVSGGNDQKITLAKSIFTNVIIGLVIIFTSWLLIDTLFKTIADGTVIGAWNVFPPCN